MAIIIFLSGDWVWKIAFNYAKFLFRAPKHEKLFFFFEVLYLALNPARAR